LNPLGVKGVGEAGAIPVGAAVASAVEHALGGAVQPCSLPIRPTIAALVRDVDRPAPAISAGG
jgi:CO/xanthine dehydrogenase Mo-binding subunit